MDETMNGEWQDWPATVDDPLDVPDYLRIPQEARREAWKQFNPTGKTGATPTADNGPGSTCRKAGIPDGINQDLVERMEELEAIKEARKKQDEQARFVVMRAKAAAEKAELASVKEAVQKTIKRQSTKRRRRSF